MKQFFKKVVPLAYGQYFNVYSLVDPKKAAESAFHVFCTVRKGRVRPEQAPYLEEAKLSVEEVAGHKVQSYRWAGQGDTVLLVHGWESNTFRWRNLIKKLREADFNIIAFDAPSHGYSTGKYLYVPLYEEALNHMVDKYVPKHLIGHSVGGMTIIYNQYKNPCDHVDKIVTIGSPSEFHEIVEHFQDLLKFNDRMMGHLDAYVHHRFGFQIREFSTSKFVRHIDKKGLLFHDRHDNITPYHASVAVNKNWKNSTLISTEGLGHSMHQDDVNDHIISFLEA